MNVLKSTALLAAVVGCHLTVEPVWSQTTEPAHSNEIQGTWRQVSATNDGKPLPRAEGATLHLYVTSTQFVQIFLTKDKVAAFVAGGHWTLAGDELSETIEYTSAGAEKGKGQTFVYHSKMDGARLILSGTFRGQQGEEIWERDDSK